MCIGSYWNLQSHGGTHALKLNAICWIMRERKFWWEIWQLEFLSAGPARIEFFGPSYIGQQHFGFHGLLRIFIILCFSFCNPILVPIFRCFFWVLTFLKTFNFLLVLILWIIFVFVISNLLWVSLFKLSFYCFYYWPLEVEYTLNLFFVRIELTSR